jgi:regulator of cell morphogenesis and NO signaling
MNIQTSDTVGSIVTRNLHAAQILTDHGLDFCCGGQKSLQEACEDKHIAIDSLMKQLGSLADARESQTPDFVDMNLIPLTKYIEKIHHKFTMEKILFIKSNLSKLINAHSHTHPELTEIKQTFDALSDHLTVHMKREELMVFPYIRNMTRFGKTAIGRAVFGYIENPILDLVNDHQSESKKLKYLDNLTNHYAVPSDGCNTYTTTYQAMKELETDLYIHMHLENNILFPKAVAVEKVFRQN